MQKQKTQNKLQLTTILTIIFLTTIIALTGCQQQPASETITSNYEQINQIIKNENPTIVDVRTPEEYNKGHLEGAINMNFYENNFFEEMEKLQINKPIIIYCLSGHRSDLAVKGLKGRLNVTIYEISGGIMAWQENGGKITEAKYNYLE